MGMTKQAKEAHARWLQSRSTSGKIDGLARRVENLCNGLATGDVVPLLKRAIDLKFTCQSWLGIGGDDARLHTLITRLDGAIYTLRERQKAPRTAHDGAGGAHGAPVPTTSD